MFSGGRKSTMPRVGLLQLARRLGTRGHLPVETAASFDEGGKAASQFSHARDSRPLLHAGQARIGATPFRQTLRRPIVCRVCHGSSPSRRFQGRTHRKGLIDGLKHSISRFGNPGMPQVRPSAFFDGGRVDVRLARHAEQTSLRDGRMRGVFQLVLRLPSPSHGLGRTRRE